MNTRAELTVFLSPRFRYSGRRRQALYGSGDLYSSLWPIAYVIVASVPLGVLYCIMPAVIIAGESKLFKRYYTCLANVF